MSSEALQQAFFRETDKLRRGPKGVEPLDMAEVARKVGLPPHEAVLQIQKYAPYGRQGSGEMFDALATFLCFLCDQAKVSRVLEYTTVPSVLTARLAERNKVKNLSYLTPYPRRFAQWQRSTRTGLNSSFAQVRTFTTGLSSQMTGAG